MKRSDYKKNPGPEAADGSRGRARTNMAPSDQTLEPVVLESPKATSWAISSISSRLAELRDRGLIAPDAYDTAASESQSRRAPINRAGEYEACMVKSRGLSKSWPKQAIALGRARDSRSIASASMPGG